MMHLTRLSAWLAVAAMALAFPVAADAPRQGGPGGARQHEAGRHSQKKLRGKAGKRAAGWNYRRSGHAKVRNRAQLDGKESVVLVFDSSRSMRDRLGDKTRMQVAQRAVVELLQGWDPEIHLGLTAYGHEADTSCSDIDAIVPVSRVEPAKIVSAVNRLQPRGMTPITSALEDAAQQLRYAKNKATIILVSDGLENCKRDPCKRARQLEQMGRDLTIHVVGFGIEDGKGEKQLACIAESTGGQYKAAGDAASLRDAFGAVLDRVKKDKKKRLPPVAAPPPASPPAAAPPRPAPPVLAPPPAPPPSAEPPGLSAAQVDFSVHCCTAPPSPENYIGDTVSAVVGPGVEFPAIGRLGTTVIPADVDMTNDTIDIRYTKPMQASAGSFNGYVFEFAADGFPRITDAVLDSTSTFTPEQVLVTFDDSTVFVNAASQRIVKDSRIFIRLTFER